MRLSLQGGKIFVVTPYDPAVVAQLQMIARSFGVTKAFNPVTRIWSYPLAATRMIVDTFPNSDIDETIGELLSREDLTEQESVAGLYEVRYSDNHANGRLSANSEAQANNEPVPRNGSHAKSQVKGSIIAQGSDDRGTKDRNQRRDQAGNESPGSAGAASNRTGADKQETQFQGRERATNDSGNQEGVGDLGAEVQNGAHDFGSAGGAQASLQSGLWTLGSENRGGDGRPQSSKSIPANSGCSQNAAVGKAWLEGNPHSAQIIRAIRPGGNALFEYQLEDIGWLLTRGRAIFGSDMGTGKTRSSMVAAWIIYKLTKQVLIVICPAKLVHQWRQEAKLIGHPHCSVYSWAKQPKEGVLDHYDYVLILDEAHFMQTMTTKRTQRALELAICAEAVFALTGTPMKNGKTHNIFPLMKAVGHPLAKNQKQFEVEFCGAKLEKKPFKPAKRNCPLCKGSGKFEFKACSCRMMRIWDVSGRTNELRLNAELKPWMLRRMKAECLDLPPKMVIRREIDVSAAAQKIYDDAVETSREKFQRMVQAGTIKTYETDEGVKGMGEALAMLGYIRKAASLAKAEACIDLIEEVIEQGHQVVVFFEFVEPVEKLAAHFGVRPYHGQARDAHLIVEAFQEGKTRVFVATGSSAGTGQTLTAASYMFMVDRPQTPGDEDQYQDRICRIGQKSAATIYNVCAFPIDDKIDLMNDEKRKTIATVLGDKSKPAEERHAAALALNRKGRAIDVLRDLFDEK